MDNQKSSKPSCKQSDSSSLPHTCIIDLHEHVSEGGAAIFLCNLHTGTIAAIAKFIVPYVS